MTMIDIREITNAEDIIDSRDVIARIEQLEGDDNRTEDESAELETLRKLADQASDYAVDWEYGEQLIRDSFFEDYARELAEEIGAIDPNAGWPLYCIDWERAARELRQDYTSVDFDGITYWIR